MLRINHLYKNICSKRSILHSVFSKIFIVIILLIGIESVAQNRKFTPSFEKTDKLIKEGKLEDAYKQLKSYQLMYPNDFLTSWKTAQLAYWTWDIENAKRYFKLTLKLDGTHVLVKEDYAKMLFAIGDYKEAAILFSELRTASPEATEIWAYNIKSYYFNNELSKAMDLLLQMPESVKSNPELLALKSEIAAYKAVNINFSTSYTDDNQPMKTLVPKFRISKMHNSYLNWYFEGTFNQFSNDTLDASSQIVKIGNKFTFNNLKLTADVHIGSTILPALEESAFIGGLLLSKKITKGVDINAELSRNPYYYSLPSTSSFVIQDNLGIALVIKDIEKFSGTFQHQNQMFNDDNTIVASSFWFLSPGIGTKKINAKIGYAFEAMDSENDNFESIKPLAQVVEEFGTNTTINGIYNDYFTPQNQKIHSALVAIQLKLTPKTEINLVGSYGFSAKWDNPFLFLNEDSMGQLFIDKGFATENFKPATFKADFTYAVNTKLNMGLHYNYFKTAFFTANTFMLNLNYKIFSEK